MRNQIGKIATGCVACARLNGLGRPCAGASTSRAKRLGRGRVAHLHVHSNGNHRQPSGGGGVEAHRQIL